MSQVTGRQSSLPPQDGVATHEKAQPVDEAAGLAGGDQGIGVSGQKAFADGVGESKGEAVNSQPVVFLPLEAGGGHFPDGVGVGAGCPAGGVAGKTWHPVGGDAGSGPAPDEFERLAGGMALHVAR